MESVYDTKRRGNAKFSVSPRLAQLKATFEANGGTWKEYRIGDLFSKKTIKGVPKNEENLTPNSEGYHMFGQNIKYQYQHLVMQDKKYLQVVDKKHPILAYTSSVGEIGMIEESFYRTGNNGAFQGLFPKYKFELKQILYILAILKKQFIEFGYATSMANIMNLKFKLPTLNGKIAFDFMESYISELEQERISELAAYLKVTGLDNYELTKKERKALASYPQRTFRTFRIGDLFTCSTGDTDLQQKDINGKGYPFINSGAQNLGIKGKTDRKARVFNSNTITIDFWGFSFYRDFEYKLATHNHVFSLSGEIIKNSKIGLYLVSTMTYFTKMFSYNNMGTIPKIKELIILLPVNPSGAIDYNFMETYISAIQKQTIKGVVEWKNKVIKATKQVINK